MKASRGRLMCSRRGVYGVMQRNVVQEYATIQLLITFKMDKNDKEEEGDGRISREVRFPYSLTVVSSVMNCCIFKA